MTFELFGGKKRNQELMESIITGNLDSVRRLLEDKANPNYVWKMSQSWASIVSATPLHTALLAPKGAVLDIVQLLLEKGADTNAILESQNPHSSIFTYQSPLLLAVTNMANATDKQYATAIYCALRFANADMYCTPAQHIHQGDAAFANMDYWEWEICINRALDENKLRSVWVDLEQTFESARQKKSLNAAVAGSGVEPIFRRIKI